MVLERPSKLRGRTDAACTVAPAITVANTSSTSESGHQPCRWTFVPTSPMFVNANFCCSDRTWRRSDGVAGARACRAALRAGQRGDGPRTALELSLNRKAGGRLAGTWYRHRGSCDMVTEPGWLAFILLLTALIMSTNANSDLVRLFSARRASCDVARSHSTAPVEVKRLPPHSRSSGLS